MTLEEFEKACERTTNKNPEVLDRLASTPIGLIHGIVGINSEAGELADALKRSVFYGKPLDKANVGEELGDLLWYVVEAAHAVGMTLSEVMEKNVAKLKVRYPTEFTETAALNRDLDAERMTLEERSK